MDNYLFDGLQRELRALDAQLRSDPRYVRAQLIRELLRTYEQAQVSVPIVTKTSTTKPVTAKTATGLSSKAERVRQVVRQRLANGPMHRVALLEELERQGIMGKEKSPIRALAILLTGMKDELEGDGRGHYALKNKAK